MMATWQHAEPWPASFTCMQTKREQFAKPEDACTEAVDHVCSLLHCQKGSLNSMLDARQNLLPKPWNLVHVLGMCTGQVARTA